MDAKTEAWLNFERRLQEWDRAADGIESSCMAEGARAIAKAKLESAVAGIAAACVAEARKPLVEALELVQGILPMWLHHHHKDDPEGKACSLCGAKAEVAAALADAERGQG